MQIHRLAQGSPEWLAHRATCWNASDAPAMMGESPYQTRGDLLKQVYTGLTAPVDAATQRVFDIGHRSEELARPLAAEIIGDDLFRIVGSIPVQGLQRPLSASFDGLPMDDPIPFEHKALNEVLRDALPHVGLDAGHRNSGAALPLLYAFQMEQQLLVCGGRRVLFMATRWTNEGELDEARWCWYEHNPELRERLLRGWAQFEADLAAFVMPAAAEPAPVAKIVEHLPVVLDMRVEGKLVACNLEQYKPAALAYIAKINTALATDQHFADADADAKFCREAADKLELAIKQAMGQMGDINTAIETVRQIAEAFDAKALQLEKLVGSEKERRKGEIVAGGFTALRDHVAALNQRLGKPYMPSIPADFAGAVKNKRNLASMESGVATELARAKIEASRVADVIHGNLQFLREHAKDFAHLFPDTGSIVLKAPEDLQALAKARIAEHREAEERRREQIRAEEAARVEREQAAKADAERQAQEAEALAARQREEAAARAPRQSDPAAVVQVPRFEAANTEPAAANVVPLRQQPPAGNPTLRLGVINERLAGICRVTSEDLAALGFPAAARERSSVLFHEAQWPEILTALIQRLTNLRDGQKAAA